MPFVYCLFLTLMIFLVVYLFVATMLNKNRWRVVLLIVMSIVFLYVARLLDVLL